MFSQNQNGRGLHTTGVPQGSILGPLIFLIYVNDLPKNVSNNLILYADDTTAVVKAKSDQNLEIKVSEALTELNKWFKINGLKLNPGKTQLVKLCTPQSRDSGNLRLSTNENSKFLGLYIDKHLNWGKCIENLLGKLNSACYQMLCLRDTLDIKTRLMVYYGYFYSIMQYGIEFWGFSPGADRIFKVQKKFLRIMTYAPWKSSCKPIFKKHKIMTVPNLTIYKILLMVQSNYEIYSNDNFEHVYNTRYKTNFQLPIHRLRLVEKTPVYAGKKLFNKLPASLKSKINSNFFKSSLNSFLLDKNYYCITDYLTDCFI